MRLSKILWFVSGVQINIIIYWSQKLRQIWLICETVICRSHGGLLATEKGEKFALNDKDIILFQHIAKCC